MLASVRVLIGLLVAYGAVRFMAEGWVERLLLEPEFFFSYYGFAWVPRPGAVGAYAIYVLLTAAGVCVAAGYRYRVSAPLLFASFTYSQLLDATNYLNHYYLLVLLTGLLCFVPAHRRYSLDVAQGRTTALSRVPAWTVWAFAVQLSLVYVCAGVAKLNADWLLEAMPMAVWLPEHRDWPMVGSLLAKPVTAHLASWAGMLYDCTIVAWLLLRRTRRAAYLAVLAFHGLTLAMFNIGLFPLIMVALTTVFFTPAAHERFWRKLRGLGAAATATSERSATEYVGHHRSRSAVPALLAFFALQLGLAARPLVYPGPVAWGEEGYRFGWRVMLVEKVGCASFEVRDAASGRSTQASVEELLTPYQVKQMAIQPDFVLQTAQHIAGVYEREYGFASPEVYAHVAVSLNGRRSRTLIDPSVDLADVRDGLSPKPWILPFE